MIHSNCRKNKTKQNKKNPCQTRICYLAKLFLRIEDEIESFPGKLTEFITTKLALKEKWTSLGSKGGTN